MLDQKRASRAEGPRQNRVEEVVLLEIVEVEGFIIRMPTKLRLTKTNINEIILEKTLPVRVIVHVDSCGPEFSRQDATMRHEVGHHVIKNSRNASWFDRIVGVLIPTTI